jgi:hypothetical protein
VDEAQDQLADEEDDIEEHDKWHIPHPFLISI